MVCLLRVPDSNFIKKTNLCVTPGGAQGTAIVLITVHCIRKPGT